MPQAQPELKKVREITRIALLFTECQELMPRSILTSGFSSSSTAAARCSGCFEATMYVSLISMKLFARKLTLAGLSQHRTRRSRRGEGQRREGPHWDGRTCE